MRLSSKSESKNPSVGLSTKVVRRRTSRDLNQASVLRTRWIGSRTIPESRCFVATQRRIDDSRAVARGKRPSQRLGSLCRSQSNRTERTSRSRKRNGRHNRAGERRLKRFAADGRAGRHGVPENEPRPRTSAAQIQRTMQRSLAAKTSSADLQPAPSPATVWVPAAFPSSNASRGKGTADAACQTADAAAQSPPACVPTSPDRAAADDRRRSPKQLTSMPTAWPTARPSSPACEQLGSMGSNASHRLSGCQSAKSRQWRSHSVPLL